MGVARLFSALPAMRQDRLNGKFARHLAMRFSAHSVGQHIQLQRGIDRITVFIIFSDAPKVGARAGFDVQRGLIRLAAKSNASQSLDGLHCQTCTTSRLVLPRLVCY